MSTTTTTHEQFIQRVRDLVLADLVVEDADITQAQFDQLRNTKLVYGVGDGRYRGITCYQAWQNGVGPVDVVEIAATGEESWIQLAGTTIHELAHVLGGHEAGHGVAWKDLAKTLGFTKRPEAAGQVYRLAMIRPRLRCAIAELAAELNDGSPAFVLSPMSLVPLASIPPCSAGHGTRGGKSRGAGSGSRLRLWECECEPKPVKVRVASDDFEAHCDRCGEPFHKVER